MADTSKRAADKEDGDGAAGKRAKSLAEIDKLTATAPASRPNTASAVASR